MRRLVLLFSAFAFVCAMDAAAAQTGEPVKRSTARQKAAAQKPATPVDARPRYKRDDMPAPAVATPAKPAVATRKRVARGAAGATRPATETTRATPKDVAICAQAGDHDAAIASCTRIIEDGKAKPKGKAAAYYNRGNAQAAKGDQAAAIADYDAAIKLDPKAAPAYNNRGSAKDETDDADGAIADFTEAIKLNRKFASAYFNRANAHAAEGEEDRAITDYSAAIKHNRRNVNAYIARGALYLAGGAVAKARADMARAARLDRKNAYAVLWHDIAERRAKQKGVLAGGKGLKDVDMKGWPAPLLLMFVGEIKPAAVMSAAEDANPTLKEAHTCEANFYGGQHALIEGQRDKAMKLFEAAAEDCPHGFLEGIAASAELKGFGQRVGAN